MKKHKCDFFFGSEEVIDWRRDKNYETYNKEELYQAFDLIHDCLSRQKYPVLFDVFQRTQYFHLETK